MAYKQSETWAAKQIRKKYPASLQLTRMTFCGSRLALIFLLIFLWKEIFYQGANTKSSEDFNLQKGVLLALPWFHTLAWLKSRHTGLLTLKLFRI